MRSFACRRWGSLALARRSGPANTTIAQATLTLSHHRLHRAHAALSCACVAEGEGRPRVISSRRRTTECCGPAGENVGPLTKTSGLVALLLFAPRGMDVEPVGAAAAVGWTNRVGARDTLTHAKGWRVTPCLDARAAVPGRIFGQPNGRDLSAHRGSLRAPPGAVMAPAEELAVPQFATAVPLPARGRRRQPPRCLKPLATSLEAIGRRDSRAERCGRREPGAAATSASQGSACCRGAANHGCSLMPTYGLCAPSGWLRGPG